MSLYSLEGRLLARSVPLVDWLSNRYVLHQQGLQARSKVKSVTKPDGVSRSGRAKRGSFDIRRHNRFVSDVRSVFCYPEYRRRARRAEELLGEDEFAQFRKLGYLLDLRRDVPTGELTDDISAFYQTDRSSAQFRRLLEERPVRIGLRYAADLGLTEKILEFACHAKIQRLVCGYFGFQPVLNDISVWCSVENETLKGMQKLHIHAIGASELRFFLNITDIENEHGPTIILPKDKSSEVYLERKATHLADSVVEAVDLISLAGPRGTLSCVDTANCYHFGARTRKGERVIMMVKFSGPWELNPPYLSTIAGFPEAQKLARAKLGAHDLL